MTHIYIYKTPFFLDQVRATCQPNALHHPLILQCTFPP